MVFQVKHARESRPGEIVFAHAEPFAFCRNSGIPPRVPPPDRPIRPSVRSIPTSVSVLFPCPSPHHNSATTRQKLPVRFLHLPQPRDCPRVITSCAVSETVSSARNTPLGPINVIAPQRPEPRAILRIGPSSGNPPPAEPPDDPPPAKSPQAFQKIALPHPPSADHHR